jgi:hypothetical protein
MEKMNYGMGKGVDFMVNELKKLSLKTLTLALILIVLFYVFRPQLRVMNYYGVKYEISVTLRGQD